MLLTLILSLSNPFKDYPRKLNQRNKFHAFN